MTALTKIGISKFFSQPLVQNAAMICACCSIFSAVAIFLISYPNVSYITAALQDNLVFFDCAHRIFEGQLPHLDFHSPLGLLFFVIPYLGLELSGSYGGALPAATSLTLVLLTPVMIYILASRFRYYIAIPVALYLALLVTVPTILGDNVSSLTFAMWYNRLAWAIFVLLILMYMPSYMQRRALMVVDGLVAGALLACLVYLKVTYAVVGCAFCCIWCLNSKFSRPSGAIAAIVVLVVALAVELALGVHRAYVQDILMTIHVSAAIKGGMLGLLIPFLKNFGEILLASMIWGLLVMANTGLRDTLFALLIIGGSVVIINQNAQVAHLPALVALLAVGAEIVARLEFVTAEVSISHLGKISRSSVTWSILVAFVAQPIVNYSATLVFHYIHASDAPQTTVMPVMPAALSRVRVADVQSILPAPPNELVSKLVRTGRFDELRLYQRPFGKIFEQEYLYSVLSGVQLLQEIDHEGKAISVFDFANPFPFILDTPSPTGIMTTFLYQRTFSEASYLTPEDLFRHTDIVLVPKVPADAPTRDAMIRIYGDALRATFRLAKESTFWNVWIRRP